MASTYVSVERERLIEHVVDALRVPGARISLTGEPGIGKSFLLEQVLDVVAGTGVRILHARANDADFVLPFDGLLDLFAEIDVATLDLPDVQRAALEIALHRREGGEVTPGSIAVAVNSAFTALAASAPLLITVDDIDRVDEETFSVLRYAVTRPGPRDARFCVLTTATLSLFNTTLTGMPRDLAATHTLRVEALAPADLARAVLSPLQRPLTSLELEFLQTESMGNPTCAIEILSLARGLDLPAIGRPGTDRILGIRVGQLDPVGRDLLALCGLMANPSIPEAMAILGLREAEIMDGLDRGLVRRIDQRLVAVHGLFARNAAASLSESRRRELHQRIADVASDPSVRAHHRDRSTEAGTDPELAGELDDAAVRAERSGAAARAVDLLTRALARTPADDPELVDRSIRVGGLLFGVGEFERCVGVLEAMTVWELALPDFDRSALLYLSALKNARGETESKSALALLRANVGDDRERSAILDVCEVVVDGDRAPADLVATALRTLGDADVAPLTRHRGLGAMIHARVKAGGGLDESLVEQLEQLERVHPSVSVADSAQAFVGMHAYQVERLEESRLALQAARRRALQAGEDIAAGRFAVHLATVEVLSGRVAEAAAYLEEWDAVDPWPTAPTPPLVAVRGSLAVMRADDDELRRLVDAASGPGHASSGEFFRLALRAFHALRRLHWDEAVALFLSAKELADAAGVREPGARLYLDFGLARSFIAVERLDEARDVIESLERLSGGSRPVLDGVVLRLRGLLAVRDADLGGAEALMRRALTVLPESSYQSERAATYVELGRVLRAAGKRADALRALAEAEKTATACGDDQLADLAKNVRNLFEGRSSNEMLSPRERAVAVAVGEGKSNKEIAAENFISVRTVETQLSAVYRKLGLRSRAELVIAMRNSAAAR